MKKLISLLIILSMVSTSFGAPSEVDRAILEKSRELLLNPAFENGKQKWAVSTGSFSVTSGAGGQSYAVWDAGAASETFMSSLETIPTKLQGENGIVECNIKTPSGTATHTLTVNDGTNDLVTPITIQSNPSRFASTTLNFIFPSSGSIRAKLASTTNEPSIQVGRCSIRKADNVYEAPVVSAWRSYTPTFTGLGTVTSIECKSRRNGENEDIDCKYTTGTTTATEARISLPNSLTSAGTATIPSIQLAGTNSVNATLAGSLTVLIEPSVTYMTLGKQSGTENGLVKRNGNDFPSSTTFSLKASVPIAGYSAISAQAASQTDYAPTAYTPTYTGFGTVSSVDCKHARVAHEMVINCKALAGTPTATEARISLPSPYTVSSTYITAKQRVGGGTQGGSLAGSHHILATGGQSYLTIGLQSGSTGGYANANGDVIVGASNTFAFSARVPITGWEPNGRAGTLNGSVTSNAPTALRVERAVVSSSCTSSPCTIASGNESGWLTNITRSGTGSYSANIVAGTFSAAPACFVSAIVPGADRDAQLNGAPTTSAVTFQFENSGALNDGAFSLFCFGSR